MPDVAATVAVRGLQVVYQRGGQPAVSGVDLSLGAGQGLLLTGDEGAGKTSVLRAILGLAPYSGDVSVFGLHPDDRALAGRIGYGPQGRTFSEQHTPLEVVSTIVAIRRGRTDAGLVTETLDRAGLDLTRRTARDLDVEELRRLSLACAIAGDPDLLVLDDPWEFPETIGEIKRALGRGASVVAASHDPGGLPDVLTTTHHLVVEAPA